MDAHNGSERIAGLCWRLLVVPAGLVLALGTASPALAQATAPSSITPPTLRPPTTTAPPAAIPVPDAAPVAPAEAERLSVRISAVQVEGAFPAVSPEIAALVAPYAGRTVTLAQVYALAARIEAIHVRAGFILARAAVPPQSLDPGGPVRIVVVDGFLEAADVSGLPRRVREAVARRVAPAIGRRRLALPSIEQPLVLAGEIPGIRLTSTLARGDEVGGARLLLTGRQSPISGSLTVDNGLAASLGRYSVTAQLSLNALLGMGEQIYGFVNTGYDPERAFRADAPVTVVGGGVSVPSGDGRAFLNPEVTFARTRPLPTPGIPQTQGRLRRLTVRGGYTVLRTRSRSLTVGATAEQIRESNDAIDFGVRLSLDRFTAARLRLGFSQGWAQGGGISALVQLSHGLGGRDARRQDPFDVDAIRASRQGAGPFFTRLDASMRATRPLPKGFALDLFAHGQTSFGAPLFRSEQSALEGTDALSAYVGGVTAVDSSVTGRAEVSHPLPLPGVARRLTLAPYLFGAAGRGWLERPTAVERPDLALEAVGAGVRGSVANTPVGFVVEYAHGFSPRAEFDRVDRVSAALSFTF